MKQSIILASTSPRRKQLFDLLKIKYEVADSKYEEVLKPGLSHEQQVRRLALGKARAVAKTSRRAIIVAADTMVSFRGRILGKPKSAAEARAMLRSFSGKWQEIVTGVVVMDAESGKKVAASEKLRVKFKKLSGRDIEGYIKTGEPFDKAGAYGPQGPGFNLIDKIDGEFTNILGLPMTVVLNAMEKLGVKI